MSSPYGILCNSALVDLDSTNNDIAICLNTLIIQATLRTQNKKKVQFTYLNYMPPC